MMTKVLFGGAAAAAILAASGALAQTAETTQKPKPEQRGHATRTATRTDVQAHVSRFFSRVDTNKDGFVNKAEIDALQAQREDKTRTRGEKRADRSGPGNMFDRLDANKDGVISRTEFDAAPPHAGTRHAGMHRGVERMFEKADVNKDGRVSLAEAQQTALQHFDQADLNHDGQLTREERRQSRQQLRSQRQSS
jgi:Ca2+-binding EF-hand superfamily protein